MSEFKPLKKNVLIAQIARKTETSSGIIITDAKSVADNETGRVLAIGSDVSLVAVGDEVLVDWAKSAPIKIDGVQRVVINEDNIIAVIER